MPLAPRHVHAPRRLEIIFVAAFSCLLLTSLTVVKLGDALQTIAPPPHSFTGVIIEKSPTIRNKRALGKEGSAVKERQHDAPSAVPNASYEQPKIIVSAKSRSKTPDSLVGGADNITKFAEALDLKLPAPANETSIGSRHEPVTSIGSEAPRVQVRLSEEVTKAQPVIVSTDSNVTSHTKSTIGTNANIQVNSSSTLMRLEKDRRSNNNVAKVAPVEKTKQNQERVNNATESLIKRHGVSHEAAVMNGSAPLLIVSSANSSNRANAGEGRQKVGEKATIPMGEHNPTYFRDEAPLDKLIHRGNLLRVYSGCSIATWSYSGFTNDDDQRLNDCYHDKGQPALLAHQVTNETASQVQPYDTIYVPMLSLERFVKHVLPKISSDFILLTGQKSLVPPFSRELFDKIIEHPRVIHWFLQNQAVYSYDPHHPKMGIFPYGIFTKHPHAYLREMARNVTKSNFIYVGYLNKGTNKKVRKDIPRLRDKQFPPLYFAGIRNSTYVLSPDGDRPECHRHYESIGLGAMPITGLDPYLHRHLLGNAYYGENRWKLPELEEKLPRHPTVNRRLVFEEYWMEYIEREIGRPLRWWDPSRNVRCSLNDIVKDFQKS